MAEHLPWRRSESLADQQGNRAAHNPPGGAGALGRLPAVAVLLLLAGSVLGLGSTGAVFTSQAAPESSGFTASSQFKSGETPSLAKTPAPAVAACQQVANLSYDPYLKATTGAPPPGAQAGAAPAPFESLITSARSLLPASEVLPAGTVGIGASSGGVTGSLAAPAKGDSFAAGYCDESELSQYIPSAAPTCPASGPGQVPMASAEQYDICALDGGLSVAIPAGAMSEPAETGYATSGQGIPYVAIYQASQVTVGANGNLSFSGQPVLTAVPVSLFYSNYQVAPAAFGPDQPTPNGPKSKHAVITFSLAADVASSANPTGSLSTGTTYVAYLLLQDTDQSGPLADHLWYFQP